MAGAKAMSCRPPDLIRAGKAAFDIGDMMGDSPARRVAILAAVENVGPWGIHHRARPTGAPGFGQHDALPDRRTATMGTVKSIERIPRKAKEFRL
jgi:hypothetical protein